MRIKSKYASHRGLRLAHAPAAAMRTSKMRTRKRVRTEEDEGEDEGEEHELPPRRLRMR